MQDRDSNAAVSLFGSALVFRLSNAAAEPAEPSDDEMTGLFATLDKCRGHTALVAQACALVQTLLVGEDDASNDVRQRLGAANGVSTLLRVAITCSCSELVQLRELTATCLLAVAALCGGDGVGGLHVANARRVIAAGGIEILDQLLSQPASGSADVVAAAVTLCLQLSLLVDARLKLRQHAVASLKALVQHPDDSAVAALVVHCVHRHLQLSKDRDDDLVAAGIAIMPKLCVAVPAMLQAAVAGNCSWAGYEHLTRGCCRAGEDRGRPCANRGDAKR